MQNGGSRVRSLQPSLVAQRDTGIGRWAIRAAASARALAALGCGSRFRLGIPRGTGFLPGFGPVDDPGLPSAAQDPDRDSGGKGHRPGRKAPTARPLRWGRPSKTLAVRMRPDPSGTNLRKKARAPWQSGQTLSAA